MSITHVLPLFRVPLDGHNSELIGGVGQHKIPMSDHPAPAPSYPFFIGLDSDGTVFDSMEIKHKRVFQPLAIEMWGLQPVESEFCRIAEFINLYSVHRGVNRFQGLAMAFERLAGQSEAGRGAVAGASDLLDFVLSGAPLSAGSLAEYNATKQSPFLTQVLDWSRRSDDLYAQITTDEGNPAYPLVRESLEQASRSAEIMVVSSSARGALLQDWGDAGLLPLTTRIAGQEMGSKAAQLEFALERNCDPSHALMVGDALGDLEAARANHILFYPVVPGAERQSWQRFQGEALARFFRGTYAGEYERELLAGFENALRHDAPWPRHVAHERPN